MAAFEDHLVDLVKNSDVATDSQVAATATATLAAVANRCNVPCKIDASYSTSGGAQSGLLTVNITTVAGVRAITKYIHGAGAIDFGIVGLQSIANSAVTAVLAAGAGGVTGTVALTYYTTGPSA